VHFFLALATLVVAAAAALVWVSTRPALTPLEQFWAPVLNGSSPLQLCAAYVPVYGVDIDPSITPPSHVSDFTLLNDQFVGGGDLIATSRLAAMLTRLRRPYRVKLGNDVSFADLRSGPAILVGFSYTRWNQISNQMRFFVDGFRRPAGITDNGKATEWALPDLPRDRRTTEDYAIVSRVFHPDTHAMLVELAGIMNVMAHWLLTASCPTGAVMAMRSFFVLPPNIYPATILKPSRSADW